MKKIICMICLFLLVTGCTAEYNLYVDKTTLKEKINVYIPNATKKQLNDIIFLYQDPAISTVGEYNMSILNNNAGIHLESKDGMMVNRTSTFWSRCYDKVDALVLNNEFSIETSGKFKCFELLGNLDQVTLKINIPGHVSSHNADSKNDTTYYWTINKSNADRKIRLTATELKDNENIIKPEEPKEDKENNFPQNIIAIFVIIGAIIVLVLAIVFHIYFKNKNTNKL